MNACEMFYHPSKSVIQMLNFMLKNACECRCESCECVARLICIIHITGVSLWLISARPCQISLFSFKFGLIVHIRLAFYGNVNTNASESLQTSSDHLQTSNDHYKCLAINKTGLRLLTNMLCLRILGACF